MTRSFACAVALTAVSVTLAAQQGQPQIYVVTDEDDGALLRLEPAQ